VEGTLGGGTELNRLAEVDREAIGAKAGRGSVRAIREASRGLATIGLARARL
jgi:hypothetical protein